MTSEPTTRLEGFWPRDDLAQAGIVPHGDDAAMRAVFAEAMTYIEVFRAPWGRNATRLAKRAIRDRGWSVVVTFLEGDDADDERLDSAVRTRAPEGFAGCIVAGPDPQPSVVWHVPPTAHGLLRFWLSHKGLETLLLPPDRSFALFGEGEQFCIFAGPPAFLRAAIARPARRHAEIARHAQEMDRINGHSAGSDLLAYYAEVTLTH